eukprot:Em0016g659a
MSIAQNLTFVPVSIMLAYFFRGVGRYRNGMYCEFLESLSAARGLGTGLGPREAESTGIGHYDFEMSVYPVTFSHAESDLRPREFLSARRKGLLESLITAPRTVARFIAAHVVARRMIYPGSLMIIQLAVDSILSQKRSEQKKKYNPHRAKLLATDGNHIDCIFIDRRGSSDSDPNNSKLVICCEGNAAFYEAGMIGIPLSAGYSVIGWNHPGFGESTGLPFPSQEASAIDVVVRYAATKLGFALDDIIMYGWSIGGFTCSCAAASYPDIGAVIIDASFEELSPLVERAVHPLLAPFSRGMVAEFFDLNIAEQLCRYPGPIKIIRRGQDEMMSHFHSISTNRSNFILLKLLQCRYPLLTADEALVRALHIWLSAKSEAEIKSVIVSLGINLSQCAGLLKSYLTQHGPNYPWTIGEGMSLKQKQELLVYLAGQYLVTVDESGHNELLPQEYFTIPNSSNL